MLQSLYIVLSINHSSGALWCSLVHKLGLQRGYSLLWYSDRHWDGIRPFLEVWAVKFLQYCLFQMSSAARNSLLLGVALSKDNFRELC